MTFAWSDAEGRFTLATAHAGRHLLVASWLDFDEAYEITARPLPASAVVDLDVGAEVQGLELRLRPSSVIRGHVRVDGQAAVGATVEWRLVGEPRPLRDTQDSRYERGTTLWYLDGSVHWAREGVETDARGRFEIVGASSGALSPDRRSRHRRPTAPGLEGACRGRGHPARRGRGPRAGPGATRAPGPTGRPPLATRGASHPQRHRHASRSSRRRLLGHGVPRDGRGRTSGGRADARAQVHRVRGGARLRAVVAGHRGSRRRRDTDPDGRHGARAPQAPPRRRARGRRGGGARAGHVRLLSPRGRSDEPDPVADPGGHAPRTVATSSKT